MVGVPEHHVVEEDRTERVDEDAGAGVDRRHEPAIPGGGSLRQEGPQGQEKEGRQGNHQSSEHGGQAGK